MEQAQYWKWMMRRRELLKSHFEVSMNSLSDSWEEKAFAEDAARCLGGCSWPPRSYSCSFCSREFRSAQALGGHMNVHRRDRARLKQSLNLSPDNNEVVVPSPHHHQNHSKNPDPKSAHDDKAGTLDHFIDDLDKNSSVSASRVSALSAQVNFSTSSIAQEKHKRQSFGSDSTAKRPLNNVISGSKPEPEEGIKLQVGEDSLCLGADDDDNHVETNLSVGLNSVFIQNRRPTVTRGEEAINYKRPKVAVSTLQYSPLQWQQVLGLKPATSIDGLDLELRLGVHL